MRMLSEPIEYERRTVRRWLDMLLSGELALPKFQRSYVWTDGKIGDLVMALLAGRPVGTMLLIDRYTSPLPKGANPADHDAEERFKPRRLSQTSANLAACTELILDGQQRLTSLWRALELGAATGLEETEQHERHAFLQVGNIWAERLAPNEVQFPRQNLASRLLERPDEAAAQGLIPLRLFNPEYADPATHEDDKLFDWCNVVSGNNMKTGVALWHRISEQLRKLLLDRHIWYAKLPQYMERGEAIEVYVKVNESSAVIRKFDIAVAEYDGQTSKSLRQQISRWAAECKRSRHFFGDDEETLIPRIGELVLKIACLQEGKNPTDKYLTDPKVLDRIAAPDRLSAVFNGIAWVLDFFGEQCIWREKHLPSAVPLRVLPALFPEVDAILDRSDAEGVARRCLRSYLWRAFFTDRYSRTATTRLKEDFDVLRRVFREFVELSDPYSEMKESVPIFGRSFSLPPVEVLHDLEQPLAPPTKKDTLSRALMVASLKTGARDFGSGEIVSESNIDGRQAHHLFPKGFLHSLGGGTQDAKRVNHCLNYALVSGTTNKKMSAKPPLVYLRDRLGKDPGLTEDELMVRVRSHLVPYGALCVKEPYRVRAYEAFLKERATRMEPVIRKLADGKDL